MQKRYTDVKVGFLQELSSSFSHVLSQHLFACPRHHFHFAQVTDMRKVGFLCNGAQVANIHTVLM